MLMASEKKVEELSLFGLARVQMYLESFLQKEALLEEMEGSLKPPALAPLHSPLLLLSTLPLLWVK